MIAIKKNERRIGNPRSRLKFNHKKEKNDEQEKCIVVRL